MKPTRLWIYSLMTRWLPESRCFGFKNALLRWAGAKIGKSVRIYSSVSIHGSSDLTIGDDVHIGFGVRIIAVAPVRIGSCVDIGPEVIIETGTHEIDRTGSHVAGSGLAHPVTVGDGCWLGVRSLILPGASLPRRTLVAAGSVVVKSPEKDNMVVAGVPAIEKKSL